MRTQGVCIYYLDHHFAARFRYRVHLKARLLPHKGLVSNTPAAAQAIAQVGYKR
jgi:hypothetical protein